MDRSSLRFFLSLSLILQHSCRHSSLPVALFALRPSSSPNHVLFSSALSLTRRDATRATRQHSARSPRSHEHEPSSQLVSRRRRSPRDLARTDDTDGTVTVAPAHAATADPPRSTITRRSPLPCRLRPHSLRARAPRPHAPAPPLSALPSRAARAAPAPDN